MGGRRSATHGIGDAGEVDEAVAIFVALLAFFRFAILAHPAQSRIAEDDPFESSDRKQISSLDLLDGEQFPPHHHEEVLDLDRLQVFAVRGVRRREVRVVLGQDGVERFTEGDRARVQAREPDQRIFLPGASSVRLVDLVVLCRFDIRRMVGCHDRLGLFRFALGEESLLLLLRLLSALARARMSSAVSCFRWFCGKSSILTANILLTYATRYASSALEPEYRSRSSLFAGAMSSSR